MKLPLEVIFLCMITTILAQTTESPRPNVSITCIRGQKGMKGVRGIAGVPGGPGGSGEPGILTYLGSVNDCDTKYECGYGDFGEPGDEGLQGERGESGLTGNTGQRGPPGEIGERGPDGLPGASNDNVLFLPYMADKTSDNVCYSFRRYCYVPGITSGWRAWYRKGKSGFLVHNKWMYFVTLSKCPCKYKTPSLPQPVKSSECLQGNCK